MSRYASIKERCPLNDGSCRCDCVLLMDGIQRGSRETCAILNGVYALNSIAQNTERIAKTLEVLLAQVQAQTQAD